MQAVLAYDGQAYKGLRAKDFKEDDLIFLNSHLCAPFLHRRALLDGG